ncbi:DNA-binding transcriptional regulator, MarR family [Paenibacillus uliginis N3/975]|uniref:DNA-binding transcriptional regulator, MarR family n=1 Tax=Paenibacillus uliginis N3/975 TaxID=1313296 RepID=A0A1X7HPA2_9BACL|nr:MarR family transcriptional regulator [Paenibacillus uliginis]SMF90432.1 DNA-binding transcriptional regulator, MarR family [Paenibacillus uliginis N3/975]
MFDLNDCICFITNTASKKIIDEFNNRLENSGTTRVQWMALYFIGEKDGIIQKELSQKMNVQESSIARLMDRMEKENLCYRIRDVKDRRITRVRLTPLGETLREELLPFGQSFHNEATQNISQEELSIFKEVLNKMVRNLSKNN